MGWFAKQMVFFTLSVAFSLAHAQTAPVEIRKYTDVNSFILDLKNFVTRFKDSDEIPKAQQAIKQAFIDGGQKCVKGEQWNDYQSKFNALQDKVVPLAKEVSGTVDSRRTQLVKVVDEGANGCGATSQRLKEDLSSNIKLLDDLANELDRYKTQTTGLMLQGFKEIVKPSQGLSGLNCDYYKLTAKRAFNYSGDRYSLEGLYNRTPLPLLNDEIAGLSGSAQKLVGLMQKKSTELDKACPNAAGPKDPNGLRPKPNIQ